MPYVAYLAVKFLASVFNSNVGFLGNGNGLGIRLRTLLKVCTDGV